MNEAYNSGGFKVQGQWENLHIVVKIFTFYIVKL